MAEEDHGDAALSAQRLRRGGAELRRVGPPQHRVGRTQFHHLDAGLGGEHVLREAPRGELVQRAFGVFGGEGDESDLTVGHEIEARRHEDAVRRAGQAGRDDQEHAGDEAHG